ncbi:acetyltransferase (GNAT) family protein [Diaminobutyricimonas aerilata]|uniref:Acetyltransferase (GNAT) family protein n=1 Tax=Diaminobutyricimonas aerilata TaxID=1162967 RepID=A0A2M9CM50_9MICO|nr:GNAT family N-acetyltransferase [Diaminobutyricimonas aerilata]PJJ72972.1 acetyltransferase (GNAT) family protein [Diaminobutyricimonas aerilata]
MTNPSTTVTARPATRDDVPQLAAALGAAFQTDPVMSWIYPDPGHRARRVAPMFEVLARRFHLRHGHTQVATDGARTLGGAMWDPPEHWQVGAVRTLLALPQAVAAMGGATGRGLAVTNAFEAVHPYEPHFYLAYIGARPEAQGRGVGSTLMRFALAEADRLRMPAYLESSDEANVGYYERFGFRVVGEVRLPHGPLVPTMWRPAQS